MTVQIPPTQVDPLRMHKMPQPPQLALSLFGSTHVPPQFIVPPEHVEHTPLKQTGVAPEQAFPHAPQLLESHCRLVQIPAQTVPVAQVQRPPRQWGAAGSLHCRPQAPQLPASVVRSVQAPPQQ